MSILIVLEDIEGRFGSKQDLYRFIFISENVFNKLKPLYKVKMDTQSIGPIPIQMEDHSRVLCEQLQQLRNQNGLLDLDIVCEVRC